MDLIYPKTCGICGNGKNTFLCKKCENKLKEIAIFGQDEYKDKFFEKHFYIFKYQGIVRNIFLKYKFNEMPYLYNTFSVFFNKYQKIYFKFDFYDIIIPIPISKKRLKQRGYDQSLLISRDISKILDTRLEKDVLIKKKENKIQSKLNKNQRNENVKNVYEAKYKEKIVNKNILLIDDIYTTGATANECSKILKIAGANKIDILTIAKD